MKTRSIFLGLLVVLLTVTPTLAVPTDITVRVRAKDAKFVGDTMGGARVTIRDAETGELLAKGVTTGTTGDTGLIMKIVNPRGKPISDEKAAKFTATIDIDEPRLIEVSAYGPLANLQAANRVSATQWVVPGKHITGGDAWMIELPGFVVDVQAPPLNTKLNGLPQDVKLEANVILMWGCHLTPGGVWDANKIEVAALLKKNGERVGVLPMQYAGVKSQFSGIWKAEEAGVYEAIVYAYDPANGNTGVDSVTFSVK